MKAHEQVILDLEEEATNYRAGSHMFNLCQDGVDSIRILMGDNEAVLEANKELTKMLSKKVSKAGSKPARKKR
tara:strand:- start:450 stop:668 length:219 start_codon:yes stop_codon:yes gene_type:complete